MHHLRSMRLLKNYDFLIAVFYSVKQSLKGVCNLSVIIFYELDAPKSIQIIHSMLAIRAFPLLGHKYTK